MMEDMVLLQLSDFNDLLKNAAQCVRYGDDYIYSHFVRDDNGHRAHFGPEQETRARFSGLTLLLVDKGKITGKIDDRTFEMGPDSLLVFGRWNSLNFVKDEPGEIDVHLLVISSQFLHDIDIDVNAINMHALLEERTSPVLSGLSGNELEMLRLALKGFYRIGLEKSHTVYTRNMSRSITQFLIYTLLQLNNVHFVTERREGGVSRQVGYAQEFMRLLALHHTHSRDITFYADKLHISPKYLSHLIKESTGKSASEWIGEFVVREAKNMLRYSNKNVQQVAYALNFTTQSSFGKYFKHITGMSPTEYQKS